MSANKLVRQLFMQWGYARGVHCMTHNEYRAISEDTRIAYDMTLEEYLKAFGLNIEIHVI